MKTFRVIAVGSWGSVSLICQQGQSMLDWLAFIVERGGTYRVETWSQSR